MSRRLVPSLAGFVIAACASLSALAARADIPPPDGRKFVDFAFTVQGLAQRKDFALVGYPCSSDGAGPAVAAMVVIQEGVPVEIGRRGGACKVFSIARADLDAFRKDFPGDMGGEVDALFASSKVHECSGAPAVITTIAASDPRDRVVQALRVAKLDATGCALAAADGAPSTPPRGTDPPSTNPPPGKSGCAGCSVPREPLGLGSIAAMTALVAFALRRRRR
jgi:MYXO-CTERM domain-containing protein